MAERVDLGGGDYLLYDAPLYDAAAALAVGLCGRPEPTDGPRVYRDRDDWWIGYYRGATHHYVCPLPTLVIRWRRRA